MAFMSGISLNKLNIFNTILYIKFEREFKFYIKIHDIEFLSLLHS